MTAVIFGLAIGAGALAALWPWLAPLAAIAFGAWLAWRRARAPALVPAEISPAERAELASLVAADEP